MAHMLREDVSGEDISLFKVYNEKHLAVGANLHSWMRIGLAGNAGLLAVVAFLVKPPGSEGVGGIWALTPATSLPILALSVVGLFYSLRWKKGHQDMINWQMRTNAVLGRYEEHLLKPEFVTPWRQLREAPEQSLEQPAMYNMINAYHLPIPSRRQDDVVDRMTAIPTISMTLWGAMGGWALVSLVWHAWHLTTCV